MVAVTYPLTDRSAVTRPTLIPLPGGRVAGRPSGAGRRQAVYRRRRAAALGILVVAAVGAAAGLRIVLAGLGGGPLATTGSSGALPAVPAGASVHVVEPGDTIWSIVRASGIRSDPRPVVDHLQQELHGRPLQIGERVLVP